MATDKKKASSQQKENQLAAFSDQSTQESDTH